MFAYRNRLWAVMVLAVALAACSPGVRKLTPVDQAAQVGLQLTDYYETIHKQALWLSQNGTPEQRDFMRIHVNPTLNRAKKLLIQYHYLVLAWKQTGTEPPNITEVQTELSRFLQEAAQLILEVVNREVKV